MVQHIRCAQLRTILRRLNRKYDHGVPKQQVTDEAACIGIPEEQTDAVIETLIARGEVTETSTGRYIFSN